MLKKAIFYLSFSLLFFTFPSALKSQTKILKVGLAGGAPFVVIDEENDPAGIAVEIWEEVADKNGWKYEYVKYSSVKTALTQLKNNKVDVLVGPISITSDRVTQVRFSQPFYQSSLAIVSRVDKPTLWDRVKPFFSFKLLIAVGIFLIILAMVGTFLWLAERKASPEQFPAAPASGIANGMWLAIVTMSTTGYGDKAPITVAGRIIAGTWMVVSIIFATSMVAGIASTLTLSGLGEDIITNVEQLSSKKTATIKGSPAEEFLTEHGTRSVTVANLERAMSKLESRQVDAVVYDRPQILFYLKTHAENKLFVSKAQYYRQGYGFAFPLGSELTHDVNIKLLELAESETTERTIRNWIGKDE